MNEDVLAAFNRLMKIALAELGDAAKDDLVVIGRQLLTDGTKLEDSFPELFESEDDDDDDDDNSEEDNEDENNDSDDIIEESADPSIA